MKIKELCTEERPREKMASKGAGALTNAELLAILIGSGTQKENVLEVANRLLASPGSDECPYTVRSGRHIDAGGFGRNDFRILELGRLLG